MKHTSRQMAFGGMMTAVAVVIMCMGSLIPVNTYVCPVLCILITRLVIERSGRHLGWCYYGAVGILGLLLAPDKEAALVYAFLGYYPMVKPWLDRMPGRTAVKLVLFTAAGCAIYGLLLFVMGVESVQADFEGMGTVMLVVLVLVWDFLFLMVDRLLGMKFKRK